MIDLSQIKITRSRRKTLALHFIPDGTIEVRAPNLIPKFLINDFIKKNSDWIEKKLGMVKKSRPATRKYIDGELFDYLGKQYALQTGNYVRIEIKGDKLLFPKVLLFRVKKELENWYLRQAKAVIIEQANSIAKEMGTSFKSIKLSETKSKWGSCTHDNRLQFNWKLIMTPILVLRYVVIHELSHTIEKNHSRKFWSRVAAFNPSFKQQIKWLREHGGNLSI